MAQLAILYWDIGFGSPTGGPGVRPFEINGDASAGVSVVLPDDWKNQASSAKILVPGWLLLRSRATGTGSWTWIQGPRDVPDFGQILRPRQSGTFGGKQDFNDECEVVACYPTTPTSQAPAFGRFEAVYRLDMPLTLDAPGLP